VAEEVEGEARWQVKIVKKLMDLTRVMTEHSSSIAAEVAPANASVWTRIMPRLWLNPSFKFPVR
jgi:hypothetical protein